MFDRVLQSYNYMFKINYRNTRTRCEICSRLTIKTPELCSSVSVVNFEQVNAGWGIVMFLSGKYWKKIVPLFIIIWLLNNKNCQRISEVIFTLQENLTIHLGESLCFTEFSTKIHWITRLAVFDVFICLHSQLSSFNSIIVQMSEKRDSSNRQ